jgi:GNAT superfamily N-acetyltransferase
MNIRDAEAKDAGRLIPLLRELGYDVEGSEVVARLKGILGSDSHHVFLAEEDDRLVGLLHVFDRPALEKPHEAVVQAIVVSEQVRDSGVGAALMREAEGWARERGLASVALYTRTDRAKAHAFYEARGYRVKGTSHLMQRPLEE